MNTRITLLALFSISLLFVACAKDNGTSIDPEKYEVYTVVEGDILYNIAERFDTTLDLIVLANEAFLVRQYDEFCGRFDESVRNNPERTGVWCNDLFNRPYQNLIFEGNDLKIPRTDAPPVVEQAIAMATGDRIALVIDDTGSMRDDMIAVTEWYSNAVDNYGRDIVGIFLYADGDIRKFTRTGQVEYNTEGDVENTFQALQYAMEHSGRRGPDTIVLITDEPGDDWDWNEVDALPPIIANCLGGSYYGRSCERNLTEAANRTGGQYVPLSTSGPRQLH
jgi:hypothetical protein